MHFHMPKPIHGWREFFGEVGIIVVGVLIALSAEQLIEEWNWDRKVEEGEASLQIQDSWDSLVLARQVAVAPCVTAQIDVLSAALRKPGHWGGIQSQANSDERVIWAPSASLGDVAWQRLQNDGTSSHLNAKRRLLFAAFQIQRADLQEYMQESSAKRASLLFLSQPADLDSTTRFAALRTLGELRQSNKLEAAMALEMLSNLRDLGHIASRPRLNDFMAPNPGGTIAYCRSHGLPIDDWKLRLAKFQSPKY